MKTIARLLSLVLLVLLAGYRAEAPERSCDVKTLILNKSFFPVDPDKVTSEYFESPVKEASGESAGYSFYVNRGAYSELVQQDVFRYRFVEDAISFYEARERNFFRVDRYAGPWGIPEELQTINLHADQAHFACGVDGAEKVCMLVARYQEYYVFFSTTISDNGMTPQDFANAVRKIDELMLTCFAG